MTEALSHPEHGYYMKQDPFGTAGDFTTAPEISQVFGELIGLFCADVWQRQGASRPFSLVEFGPGRGTLMADVLRAVKIVPGFTEAAQIRLVETSPALRARQQETLAGYAVEWRNSLDALPPAPAFFIANEFFDALPAHQFERTDAGWRERLVGFDGEHLQFVLAPSATPAVQLLRPSPVAAVGDVAEIQPAAISILRHMSEHIAQYGGGALVVDYGYTGAAKGDTLQAVKNHSYHGVLSDPGDADLTVHVDFNTLRETAGEFASVDGPVDQGSFFKQLGLHERTEILCKKATAEQAAHLRSGAHRLTAPDQMGTLFKVMSVTPHNSPHPHGFA